MTKTNEGFDQRLDTQKGLREYQTVADTVGFVPSLRVKDNVVQAICVGVGLLAGVGVGVAVAVANGAEWYIGAMLGALGGLILSTLVSGGVIMVLGWVRAAKKIK
jgi:hypothetical protein